MDELKKRKLIVGIVTVLVLLIMGLIPAVLVGVIGYYVFVKPLKADQGNAAAKLPEKKVKSKSSKTEPKPMGKPEPAKTEPVKEEAATEEKTADNGAEDQETWTDRESELNYQVEAILNGRMYYANDQLPTLLGELLDCCTSKSREKVYASIMASLQLDLIMLQREFTGVVLSEYGTENTETVNSLISKDEPVKKVNKEFDQLADNFWTYSGWDKQLKCGVYTAFRNMWHYALTRPYDHARFKKATAIYNFYSATMLKSENGEELEVLDHWALLTSLACFKDDPVDASVNEQVATIVDGWCNCHFVDAHKEQLASGLCWLKLEKAEYAALCSIEELKPELEPRKAELARVYGIT